MNPASTPPQPLEADPELVALDFAATFDEQPETAVLRLEALVRDRASCLGRIGYLRVLHNRTDQPLEASLEGVVPDDLTAEIDLVVSGSLFEALAERGIPPERVERLHRLTLTPAALWAAHGRFWDALEAPSPEESASEAPSSRAADLLAHPPDPEFVAWLRETIAPLLASAPVNYRTVSLEALSSFFGSLWFRRVSESEFYLTVGETVRALECARASQAPPPTMEPASPAGKTVSWNQARTALDAHELLARDERFRALRENAVREEVPELYVVAVLCHYAARSLEEVARLLELPVRAVRLYLAEASADLDIELV